MARLSGSVLNRGSGGTVVMAAPAGSSPGSTSGAPSAFGEFTSGVGDVTQGRISLLILNSLVLLLVVFYIATHRAQGGG